MSDIQKLRTAADQYAELAQGLSDVGLLQEAEFGYAAAAAIDSADEELQKCWGGPFNGQAARCDLVQKIIQLWNPVAIMEAGTFRGITTEWLASVTQVPIFTCEKNKRYFLQSRQRLARYKNVHPRLQDSREFIRELARTDIIQQRVLIYLDAHWEQDLPLREEIQLIFQSFKFPCIIVDDFMVPFDSGYTYDDYGPGKALTLQILDGLLPPDVHIAFPSTPSSLDTGARRGAIVLMRSDSTDVLASTQMIRLGDVRDWRVLESEAQYADVLSKLRVAERQAEERIQKIAMLTELNIQLQQHADERMLQINELTNALAEVRYHADERMRQIEELTKMVTEAQSHADERMRQINELNVIIDRLRK